MREGTDLDVPAVPSGPRALAVLWSALALMGAVGVGIGAMSAHDLAGAAGLGEQVTAVVVEKERVADPPRRGCRDYEYVVEWAGGRADLGVCRTKEAAAVDEGGSLTLRTLPWSSEVSVAGASGGAAWDAAFLGLGLALLGRGALMARRWWRVGRPGRGPGFPGRVLDTGPHSVVVEPAEPRTGPVLVLVAATKQQPHRVGDVVQVWATGRTWLRRRPRGPWVIRAGAEVTPWGPAWWRRR